MTRGAFNWTYKDVVEILKEHGFFRNYIDSSHHYYIRVLNGRTYQVMVPYHGSKAFKPKTLSGMIVQSGLTRADWGL